MPKQETQWDLSDPKSVLCCIQAVQAYQMVIPENSTGLGPMDQMTEATTEATLQGPAPGPGTGWDLCYLPLALVLPNKGLTLMVILRV